MFNVALSYFCVSVFYLRQDKNIYTKETLMLHLMFGLFVVL